MIIAKVFQNEKVIDEGIASGMKHWAPSNTEQLVSIYDNSNDSEEREHIHDESKGIYFIEYQDNGKGFEPVYDSRERIDRTVSYPLPNWFTNSSAGVPKHEHRYENGKAKSKFKGYY